MADETKLDDMARAKKEAAEELKKERMDLAKCKMKDKLREIDQAEKIVKNLKRELEDLEDELSQDA